MMSRYLHASLIALPVLIAAELVVHRRVTGVVSRFVERRIVAGDDLPKFDLAIRSTMRLRNSVALELMLLVLVFTLGHWVWRSQVALGAATWYSAPDKTHLNLTLAGYWYCLVSIPIFQFIMFRWTLRLGLWFRLLWQISKLNLHLTGAHPDRSGGHRFPRRHLLRLWTHPLRPGNSALGYDCQPRSLFRPEPGHLQAGSRRSDHRPGPARSGPAFVMYAPALERAKRQALADSACWPTATSSALKKMDPPRRPRHRRPARYRRHPIPGRPRQQLQRHRRHAPGPLRHQRRHPPRRRHRRALLPLALTTFSLDELVTRLFKVIF